MTNAAIVLAGGSGLRMGAGRNKPYLQAGGRPLLSYPLISLQHSSVERVIVVARPQDERMVDDAIARSGCDKVAAVVGGGETRTGSELAGLAALDGTDSDIIMIHDAARPYLLPAVIESLAKVAHEVGGAVPVLAPEATIWQRHGQTLLPVGAEIVGVQTPQAFAVRPLREAYRTAAAEGWEGSDTAEIVQRADTTAVAAVPGHPWTFKVTYPSDLDRAELIAAQFLAMPPWGRDE